MSRLMLTGLMAASVFITACQQQKIGSEPTPAAQPKSSSPPPNTVNQVPPNRGPGPGPGPGANPPPVINNPPPRGPGPGPGGIITPGPGGPVAPPPPVNGAGPGPGAGGAPPPPPPGYGAGPGAGGPPPPYNPPPAGNGPGPGYGPGNGPGSVYPTPGPGPGNGGAGPGYGPGNGPGNGPGGTVTPNPPPVYNPPSTPPPNYPPTGNPPTTVNPPTQQPTPPNLQPAPTVPAVSLPPTQTYPTQPTCVAAGCGDQQYVPPAPPVQQPPAPMPPPMVSKPTPPPPVPMGPGPQNPPPAQQWPRNGEPFGPPAPATPSVSQPQNPPATVPQTPIATEPPAPKPECRELPVDAELDTTKLDVLFVVDTSASMRDGQRTGMTGELAQVAKEMRTFARNLDPKTDFRIGMMLGHGPEDAKHPGYKHGTLFQTSSSDPAVIDFSKELKSCGKGKDARECAINKVVAALEKKMHALPTDHSDAQGEALMLSLYDMATMPEHSQAIKKAGLFRTNALISIIPISDEQDVCYSDVDNTTGMYKECHQDTEKGESDEAYHKRCTPAQVKIRDAKGKVVGSGPDKHEIDFYRNYCARVMSNKRPQDPILRPEDVVAALKDLRTGEASQVAITPIIYLDNSKPVREQDENEMGHGYLEMGAQTGGIFGDLNVAHAPKGQSNFGPVLEAFGKFVTTKMTIHTPFECASDVHPNAVDRSTVEVHIIDQDGKDLQIFEPQCTGIECAGATSVTMGTGGGKGEHPYMSVVVDDLKLSKALKANNFKKGKVKIKFKTDPNVDVKTGERKSNLGLRGRAAHAKKKAAQPKTEQRADLLENQPTDI